MHTFVIIHRLFKTSLPRFYSCRTQPAGSALLWSDFTGEFIIFAFVHHHKPENGQNVSKYPTSHLPTLASCSPRLPPFHSTPFFTSMTLDLLLWKKGELAIDSPCAMTMLSRVIIKAFTCTDQFLQYFTCIFKLFMFSELERYPVLVVRPLLALTVTRMMSSWWQMHDKANNLCENSVHIRK